MKIKWLGLVLILACSAQQDKPTPKINGLCLVAPPYAISATDYEPILQVHANWVAVIPYAFCGPDQPKVQFNSPRQWTGETTAGITQAISLAHEAGLQVLLKPHLWVKGQGWAGDLDFETDEQVAIWMESYTAYLLHFVQVATDEQVEMISIGTEIRQLANKYPNYWKKLIAQVRSIYPGTLTYSANWDNYEHIEFWDDLDYIGIDAYFPSTESKTPTTAEWIQANQDTKEQLKQLAKAHDKQVLFTEYGFKSIDYCASGHWQADKEDGEVNEQGQANAYEGLLRSYWTADWFAGGFAWKWHYKHAEAGGSHHSAFTPQNKMAEKILRNEYFKHSRH